MSRLVFKFDLVIKGSILTFRKDINGLRAIAVIAVIVFHFSPDILSGGFAGVDVFFVISGFLMTKIILNGVEGGTFSLLKFYIARANRIIPALAVLCIFLLFFGWFYLTPIDYEIVGKHIVSSMGFVSNITYWQESGYFDAASHEKWLLHTWSLSVEWQFYIIYPLVIIILNRVFSLTHIKLILLIGSIGGFIFSIYATYHWPNPAYFLLPTRGWEMMLGGVAYMYPFKLKEKNKKQCELLGLSLIVGSYIFISKDDLWPGFLAFIPVVGAFLVIQSNRKRSVLTGNVLFQKIGAWSYSIYLWHWPLVVAIYYFKLAEYWIYIGFLLSIALGFLSHTYVESIKFKGQFNGFVDYLKIKPIYMFLFVSLLGAILYNNKGFVWRFDYINDFQEIEVNRSSSESFYMENLNKNYKNQVDGVDESSTCSLDGGNQTLKTINNCLISKLGKGGYLIIGDSHGRDFLHSLRFAYPELNFSMLHHSSCAPSQVKSCFPLLNKVLDSFVHSNGDIIEGIIFSSKYVGAYGLDTFIMDLSEHKYSEFNVYIVGPSPVLNGNVSKEVILSGAVSAEYKNLIEENMTATDINDRLKSIAFENGFSFFDKYSKFCDKYLCKYHDQENNVYFWDSGHLTLQGIKKLAIDLKQERFLKN